MYVIKSLKTGKTFVWLESLGSKYEVLHWCVYTDGPTVFATRLDAERKVAQYDLKEVEIVQVTNVDNT